MKKQSNLEEPPGIAIDTQTIRIERLLPGPIERAWAWLTESDKRRKWLAAGEMELRVGGEVELVFRHGELSHEPVPEKYEKYEGHVMRGRVTRCDPPRLVSFTWPEERGEESEVTFELTAQNDNVLLVITHRRLADRPMMVSVASGWHAHLGVLIDRLHAREPRGFWSAHAAAEEEYRTAFSYTGETASKNDRSD